MNSNELTKESMLYELKTYSSDNTPLKSTLHFYPRYKKENENEHNFQRRLTLLAREIQDREFAKSLIDEPFLFVCTCNDGFYIAKTKKGMIRGIRFYRAKGGKHEFLRSMIYAYKIKVQEIKKRQIKLEENPCNENNQFEMKLAT